MCRPYLTLVLLIPLLGCEAKSTSSTTNTQGGTTPVITEVLPTRTSPPGPPQVFTPPEDEAVAKHRETPVSELIAKLASDDERQVAAKALASRGKGVVPELLAALDDKEPKVRAAAAFTLGQLGKQGTDAVEKLQKVAKSDDSETARDAAAFAIDAIEGK